MKDKINNNLVWVIFLIVGVIFLGVSFLLYSFDYIPKDNRVETMATIISITEDDEDYDVLISYQVDNKRYETYLGSYASSYYEGKEIVIYYDVDNPTKIVDFTSIIMMFIFGGVGSLFIIIATVILINKFRKKQMIIHLKENGHILNAKYLYTKTNILYRVNNRHPYNIFCESDQLFDGKKHIFKSQNIWSDPEVVIREKNIEYFNVYINPNNYKQYYMDIDIILTNNRKNK